MSISNTCRRLLILLAIAAIPCAALDPYRTIAQYIHQQWTAQQGFPGGAVNALAESEGYLWIGAEKGLVRFDGVHFVLYNHANTPKLPDGPVLGLNTDSQGGLWIRLATPGLVRYHDGRFSVMLPDAPLENGVTAMGRGRDGDVLLARAGDPLRYHNGSLQPLGATFGGINRLVISIAETSDGTTWMGTRDAGLFAVRDGHELVPTGLPDRKVNCLAAGNGSELWAGTDRGLAHWNGKTLTHDGVPVRLRDVQVLALTRDRKSNIWAGTAAGLMRVSPDGRSIAERRDGEPVSAVFEDREGSLWVGDGSGIQQFRDSVFFIDASSGGDGPIYTDDAGRNWLGPSSGGLVWAAGGKSGHIPRAGIELDVVYSIDGGPGELWIGRQRGGLTRLHAGEGHVSAETYTSKQRLARGSIYAVRRTRDGTVWAGSLGGGVSRIRDGRITTFTTADGLPSNTVTAIEKTADGTLWFATPDGLCTLANGKWRVYTSQDGVPPGRINSLTADAEGVLWIGTNAGIAYIRSGRVEFPRSPPEPLVAEISGIAADRLGSLWIATSTQVLRVSRAWLLGAESTPGEIRAFGPDDGLASTEVVRRQRSVISDKAGRIWFALRDAVAVVDPARVVPDAPAVVRIQSVSADGTQMDTAAPLRIPAARHRIVFTFVGLSLSVPSRVRFRYRLDGFDSEWSHAAVSPEAVYTNLGPGTYRFRVVASNSAGIWNSGEAALAFDMTPALWQTWWFRLSGIAACVIAIVALNRFRLRQVTRRLNVRFEERLAERTRMAQDLHDTLLQGLMSASMQLHVAADGVPADLPARSQLDHVIELMRGVVEEGRNAVQGLRSSPVAVNDLEDALARLREEQAIPASTQFRVIVEGRSRALNPLVPDQIYCIGREALVNAFRHSGAETVEVELNYEPSCLRLVVRDSGSGIDAAVLQSGREGHWGLIGMRERAERIGSRLKVWSRPAAGTEVELIVPGHIAFPARHSHKDQHD